MFPFAGLSDVHTASLMEISQRRMRGQTRRTSDCHERDFIGKTDSSRISIPEGYICDAENIAKSHYPKVKFGFLEKTLVSSRAPALVVTIGDNTIRHNYTAAASTAYNR